ncbi:AMP-binding protein [Sphingosinicella terrae]|uniref:AMP-binding protein n=1 Tax=Sphingosinicella terrae TaxID=2172047 RepID=UPI000E0D9C8A|nr:AMP-binding protein [Sphingosinicella terrae]
MLVTELIRRGAMRHGDRVAILFGDQRLTFREVERLSNRIANLFIAGLGLVKGSPVALLLDNGLHSVPCDFACSKAGLVRTPLNGRLSLAEHVAMLEATGGRMLVYGATQKERAAAIAAELPDLAVYGLGDGEIGPDLLALAADASDCDPRLPHDPDDIILSLFTSGTTGGLKAARHSHASYSAVVHNVLTNLVAPKAGDVMLHAASMIHASGTFVLPYWLGGGAAAILPGFSPASYVEAIERWRPTALNLVPTMLQMLFQLPDVDRADFASVETILYGASPMPRPVLERGLDIWGPVFVQYYGQTEAPLAICRMSKEEHVGATPERLLSCGRPSVECEVRLVDETGVEVAAGEPGEIVVRAPFTMKGYADPAIPAFLPGGWLRTRDIGRFDEEGFLTLIDRTSDMIVTGGYNVYPREVEDALVAHPAVAQVAVVGLPDETWGEAVTAFAVLHDPGEGDEAALIAFARERLAAYKTPKSVHFVPSIPLSAVGKPLRRALREPYWEGRERRI